jgi:glycosyltransferase involved in cell wall biosynthesis
MPAFNEEDNIVEAITAWNEVMIRTQVRGMLIVIDDGSTDSTAEKARQAVSTLESGIVLTKLNTGHGPTLLFGYRYALDLGAEWIFQTDSDLQTVPSDFWKLWALRQDFDFLIGYRSERKDGAVRVLINSVLRVVILCIFQVVIRDANSPFRLMRAEILSRLLSQLSRPYFLANAIISAAAIGLKTRVAWIPVSFLERTSGTSTVRLRRLLAIASQVVIEMFQFRFRSGRRFSEMKREEPA